MKINKELLREVLNNGRFEWSKHILQRLAERDIFQKAVIDVLISGEEIEDYPDNKPYPSALFLGWIKRKPIHVVVALDEDNKWAYIITAYEPSLEFFERDFRIRRKTMKKRKKQVSLCPLCGGEKRPGKTTYMVETEFGLVVIREVPAMVCSQCGEEWIGTSTAKILEKLVGEARKRKTQLEVISMSRAYA